MPVNDEIPEGRYLMHRGLNHVDFCKKKYWKYIHTIDKERNYGLNSVSQVFFLLFSGAKYDKENVLL